MMGKGKFGLQAEFAEISRRYPGHSVPKKTIWHTSARGTPKITQHILPDELLPIRVRPVHFAIIRNIAMRIICTAQYTNYTARAGNTLDLISSNLGMPSTVRLTQYSFKKLDAHKMALLGTRIKALKVELHIGSSAPLTYPCVWISSTKFCRMRDNRAYIFFCNYDVILGS